MMPLAVTLRLDDAAAAPILAMWRALAEGGVDDGCLRLGYPPHVTLAVWPEEAPVEPLAAAVGRFGAEWGALPVALAGFGVFPGAPAVLWAAPVVTGALLARHAALVAAVPDTPCHPHYQPGRWMLHVTLGQTDAPGRGFTHKEGDVVRISTPKLGALVNRVTTSKAAPPWKFGIRALMNNLVARGLIGAGAR